MEEQKMCAPASGNSLQERRMLARAAEFSAIRKDKLKITMLSIISVIVACCCGAIVSAWSTRSWPDRWRYSELSKNLPLKNPTETDFNHILAVSRWYGSVLFSVLF